MILPRTTWRTREILNIKTHPAYELTKVKFLPYVFLYITEIYTNFEKKIAHVEHVNIDE